jgi:hypothetical protein
MMDWEKLLSVLIACLLIFTLIRASIIAAGSQEQEPMSAEISFFAAPVQYDAIPIWNGIAGR